jgi:Uri superfamily endonuclease
MSASSSVAMDSGLYQLVIRLGKRQLITIGRHARFSFPAGYYVYTGSGKRGLESRIARHLRKQKKARWHIDYLLEYGRVLEVKQYRYGQEECELSRIVERASGCRIVVQGFGSSDCSCPAHLFYFRRNPSRCLGTTTQADVIALAVTRSVPLQVQQGPL